MVPPRQAGRSRLGYIDVFRCVAAVPVVAVHSAVLEFDAPFIRTIFDDAAFAFGPFDLGAPLFRGHLGVWVFYCISGLTMAMIARQVVETDGIDLADWRQFKRFYTAFLTKRLLRIYPLFVFHVIALNALAPAPLKINAIVLSMLANFSADTITVLSGVTWSLVIEVQFYLIFPFIYRFVRGRPYRLAGLTMLSVPFLLLSPYWFTDPDQNAGYFIPANNLPGYVFFFLFGMVLFDFRDAIARSSWILTGVPCLFVLLFWDPGRDLVSPETCAFRILTALSLASSMMCLRAPLEHAVVNGNVLARFAAFLGRASYSIYLFHQFPRRILDRWESYCPPMGHASAKIAAGIGFGCLIYWSFEIPVSRALHEIAARNKKPDSGLAAKSV